MIEQFNLFSNSEGLIIGVDFGFGNDFTVKTKIQKLSDGSLKILSSNIIGRASEMNEGSRQKVCEECENEINLKDYNAKNN